MVKETVIIKKEKKPRTQKQIDATAKLVAANKAKREAKKAAAAAPVAAPEPVAPVAPAPVKKARKPRVKKEVIKEPPILLEDSSSDDEPVEQIPEMHKAPVRPVTSHRTPKHLRY